MSIRLRFTLALVLVGLIPVVLIVYLLNQTNKDLHRLVLDTNQGIIAEAPGQISQPLVQLNKQVSERVGAMTTQLYILGGVVAVAVVVLGVLFGSTLTTPIVRMAQAAERATQGFLEAFQPSDDLSELGALSRSIYAMAIQLTEGMENLEQQATERRSRTFPAQ